MTPALTARSHQRIRESKHASIFVPGLMMLTGLAVGAVAVETLHAQAKPPVSVS
jgi:hypothetical protein